MTTDVSSGEAGTTVIELVVSLALLSLLVAFMPSTVRLGQRAWEVRYDIEARATIPSALSFLEQRLAEARPGIVRQAEGTVAWSFHGSMNRLVFSAPQPPFSPGGLYRYEVTTRPDATGLALWLTTTPTSFFETTVSGVAIEHILATGIHDFEITYFGRLSRDAAPAWSDQWNRQDEMPLLVKLSVRVGNGSLATTHQIVVEPKLGRGSNL